MGAAFEVYNQLGYGMAEEVYYLLNFGRKGYLEWKRVIVTDLQGTKEKESEH